MAHFPKPFFRPARGLWYVWHDGRQVNLGPAKNGLNFTQADPTLSNLFIEYQRDGIGRARDLHFKKLVQAILDLYFSSALPAIDQLLLFGLRE